MLAKITSKNQITIPKSVLSKVGDIDYFDVDYKDGVVVLRPLTSPSRTGQSNFFIKKFHSQQYQIVIRNWSIFSKM